MVTVNPTLDALLFLVVLAEHFPVEVVMQLPVAPPLHRNATVAFGAMASPWSCTVTVTVALHLLTLTLVLERSRSPTCSTAEAGGGGAVTVTDLLVVLVAPALSVTVRETL